jgi:predicted DNA binding CopG/RHH family protein
MKNNFKKIIAGSYNDVAKREKPIDKDEAILLEEWKSIKDSDIAEITNNERLKILNDAKKAQNNYKKQQTKDFVLNIRTSGDVIDKIKKKSIRVGLNYQTYINAILYQVANDNINFDVFIKKIEQTT